MVEPERNIFCQEDFCAGEVVINRLTDRSLDDPGGIDQFLVKFSNGIGIDVGWLPEFDPAGEYHVDLVRTDRESGWEILINGRCKTHAGLRDLVMAFAALAPKIGTRF